MSTSLFIRAQKLIGALVSHGIPHQCCWSKVQRDKVKEEAP